MAKKNKRRFCPALDKAISSKRCGQNRHSQYNCPASCAYSPFHPDNYDQFLDLESEAQNTTLDRLYRIPFFANLTDKLFSMSNKDLFLFTAEVLKILHVVRDDNGLTFYEGWKKEGYKGHKNDLRVLLKCRQSMRVSLIEIQQVKDNQTLTFIDLLNDPGRIRETVDRSMASKACRYQTIIGYYYRVPGYGRFHYSYWEPPSLMGVSNLDAFKKIVHYLGGELSGDWLLSNLAMVRNAYHSTHLRQRRQLLLTSNLSSLQIHFNLDLSLAEAAERLRRTDLREGSVDDKSRRAGYTYKFEALESGEAVSPEQARVSGFIHLKEGVACLFSMREDAMEKIRKIFEGALQDKAEFKSELRNDPVRQMADGLPAFDSSLAPPSLLEFEDQQSRSNSTLARGSASVEKVGEKSMFWHSHYQNLLDEPLSALDLATPRQASEDFQLRPKLVTWAKELLLQIDRFNLYEGEQVDLNWILDELGLDEINISPPPPRPRPVDSNWDPNGQEDNGDDDIDYLQVEVYIDRINHFLTELPGPDTGYIRMKASGCNFLDVLESELDQVLSGKARALLGCFIPAIWHALGLENQMIRIDSETLASEFEITQGELEAFQLEENEPFPEHLCDICLDPEMLVAMLQCIKVFNEGVSENEKISSKDLTHLVFYFLVSINILADYA